MFIRWKESTASDRRVTIGSIATSTTFNFSMGRRKQLHITSTDNTKMQHYPSNSHDAQGTNANYPNSLM
ncbi:hypothetical protein Hanom_Chr03g00187991 [Helianthus anomalus]